MRFAAAEHAWHRVETKQLNSLAWGLWRQDLPVTNCRLANGQRLGIEELRIGRTLPQMLVTFADARLLGAHDGQLALLPPADPIRHPGLRA